MYIRKSFFLFFALMFSLQALSQSGINSPYTRYGVGDIVLGKYTRHMALGGLSISQRGPGMVNFCNPASYTAFDTNSFVLETGLVGSISEISTTSLSQTNKNATFGYLLLGFPILKRKYEKNEAGITAWGCSLGLVPYSSVGYRLKTIDSVDQTGPFTNIYEGTGGLNQVYFGNAFRPVKNLSVGVNASLLFGTLGLNRTLFFSNTNYHSIYSETDAVISDIKFDLGLQYHAKVGKEGFFNAGLVYSNPAKMKSHNDTLVYTYITSGSNTSILDTVVNASNVQGTLNLPSSIGGGITFGVTNVFLAGVDFTFQDWSKYTYFGQSDSLANSKQISAGIQFSPYHGNTPNYFQKIQYRIGFRYADTYLKLRNTQLSEKAITFGFGLPLRKTKTMINIGFEFGERGTTDQNLIHERFGRVSLAFSLFDKWFYKKRFE
ncbi:MAG: hypothetical protein V2A54_15845 [Bacteroidota bacterium]